MKEPAVIDSTCLIAFEQTGLLHILPAFLKGPSLVHGRPTARTLPRDRPQTCARSWRAEAIALACELQHRIVVDDLQAREVAQQMGLKIKGPSDAPISAK